MKKTLYVYDHVSSSQADPLTAVQRWRGESIQRCSDQWFAVVPNAPDPNHIVSTGKDTPLGQKLSQIVDKYLSLIESKDSTYALIIITVVTNNIASACAL